ncbi:HAD family hydrolase [Microbacterium protaetiae]|uniref:HAD family hydrolase n=1 Tax=Microbacterium protaetiae TaxID=2509458 RepID=A0A4P6EGU1_9MICO|nr:HAD hydrolase-like protein [Microbacterium protaetiae]QAY59317.1 HAD family hydrolase [Microbacterium protaetiae]
MTPVSGALNMVDAWVIDVDGCLVSTSRAGGQGGTPIPGAVEFIRAVRDSGHAMRVVTNASACTPHRYAQQLREMGFDLSDDEFITAGSAAAAYIAATHAGARVLAIAEEGIVEPLAALDVDVTVDDAEGVSVVVVGAVDILDMSRLGAACHAVADNGAALYVTVNTPWFHGGRGRSVCTSAATAHAIAWVTGVEPVVLGKPSDALAATLRRQLGGDAVAIAVVGDAPAEVALAREMDALSIGVLTGALTRKAVADASDRTRTPDVIVDSIADLTDHIAPADSTRPHV